MLGIILNILKIIGIILLALIGLILLLILIILLVPIRYRFDVRKPEEPDFEGDVKISWLLRLIRVRLHATREGLTYKVHLLCFCLAGSETDSADSKKEAGSPDLPGQEKESDGTENLTGSEGTETPEGELGEDEAQAAIDIREDAAQAAIDSREDEAQAAIDIRKDPAHTVTDTRKEAAEAVDDSPDGHASHEDAGSYEQDKPEDREGPGRKLAKLYEKLQEKTSQASDLKKKADEMALRSCVSFGLDLIKRILLHILPRKLQGEVEYGFDDAYKTGQVTGYASLLYPCYGKSIRVQPHFDEKILKGWLKGCGRIRIGFLVRQVLRILINKDTRRLVIMIIRKNKSSG